MRTLLTSMLFASWMVLVCCSDDGGGTTSSAMSADTGIDSAAAADVSSNASDVVGEQNSNEANTDASPDPMGWGTAAPMTVARQETSVVAMGGEVWVLGGFDDRGQVVATLEAYNPATNTWRSAADIPTPMHHSNAAAVDGKLYVVGFLVGFGFLPDGRAYMYDPATDTWSERAPMPDGTERGGSGVAVVDGQIYVVGGLRSQATTLFSVYDPATDRWTALPDFPTPRDHMAASGIGGRVVVVGGRNRSIRSHTTRVDIFDPASQTWSQGTDMPSSRGGVAAAVVDGRFYVFGGEGNVDDPSGVFDNAEVYDVADNRWTVLDPMPFPRHGNGAAAVDGVIYIPGGADVEAFGAVDTHEIYIP